MKKSFIFLSLAALLLMPFAVFGQNLNVNGEDLNTNTDELMVTTGLDESLNSNTNTTESTSEDPVLENEIIDIIENPGTLPGSTFYFLKTWGEGIRLFFTFDDTDKAELEYKYTLRRYAEIQELIEQGETERARLQLEKAEQKMERVRERIEKATQTDGADKEDLIAKLETIQERHQDVLMRVYEQVSDDSKDSILRALENSSAGIENAIEHVQGSDAAAEFTERVESRIENEGEDTKLEVQTRLKAIRNDDADDETSDEAEPSEVTNTVPETNSNVNTDDDSEDDDTVTNSDDEDSGRGENPSNNTNENESEND